MATISEAANTPSSISAVTPDASPGWRIGTRRTMHSIPVAPSIGTACVFLAGIRPRPTGKAAANGTRTGPPHSLSGHPGLPNKAAKRTQPAIAPRTRQVLPVDELVEAFYLKMIVYQPTCVPIAAGYDRWRKPELQAGEGR
jgi:hypothetical protein